MRIVTAYAYDTAIANLQKRQQDLSETQMQLTSGKRQQACAGRQRQRDGHRRIGPG
jgi:flagellar hook-associated protein 3 FlgL